MNRFILAYVLGVAVAVTLLALGLSYDQGAVATLAVVVALAIGLLTIVPQLMAANSVRYSEHKEYFAATLLPQAGNMQLVAGDGVIILLRDRIAWKLQDGEGPILPGFGETPLFDGMLRPHLKSGGTEGAWADFASAFSTAEAKVRTYTETRREYDRMFQTKLATMIAEKVGKGFFPAWFNERAMDRLVPEPVTEFHL